MFKKVFSCFCLLILFISICYISVGLYKILSVKNNINDGIAEIENLFSQTAIATTDDSSSQNATSASNSNNSNAIGLLTFKLPKENKVAIYNSLTPENLEKGATRISGTSDLNQSGNCVLFGHRDSAFRPLWDIEVGDTVEVKTVNSTKTYTVKNIYITTPDDANIFTQCSETQLTLVTCYPFIYTGASMQRCVVVCE